MIPQNPIAGNFRHHAAGAPPDDAGATLADGAPAVLDGAQPEAVESGASEFLQRPDAAAERSLALMQLASRVERVPEPDPVARAMTRKIARGVTVEVGSLQRLASQLSASPKAEDQHLALIFQMALGDPDEAARLARAADIFLDPSAGRRPTQIEQKLAAGRIVRVEQTLNRPAVRYDGPEAAVPARLARFVLAWLAHCTEIDPAGMLALGERLIDSNDRECAVLARFVFSAVVSPELGRALWLEHEGA